MAHQLPTLPYEMNALEPTISQETLEFHYGKHHQPTSPISIIWSPAVSLRTPLWMRS